MILLYSKFYVKKDLTTDIFIEKCMEWIHGMKNIPTTFRDIAYGQDKLLEVRDGINSVEYAIDEDTNTVAFCVKLEDNKDGAFWRTDLVLQEGRNQGIVQLRLAKEQKHATASLNQKFRLPYVLRQLIADGFGGCDNGIAIDGKPHYIDESNVEMAKQCIISPDNYMMPIVYVSMQRSSKQYLVDVDQLSVDLAGIAHVVVEKDAKVSAMLKGLTKGQNPYDGAVAVYYGQDACLSFTPNKFNNHRQFRWDISHSVYRRMAMLNIPGNQSISSIRTKFLLDEVQKNAELNEKDKIIQELEIQLAQAKNEASEARQELMDYIENFGDYDDEIHKLTAKSDYYFDAYTKLKECKDGIALQCTEKEFYPDEVQDVLLMLLERTVKGMGKDESDRRSYHIAQNILENNATSAHREEFISKLKAILGNKNVSERAATELQKLGFEIRGNDHQKLYYHDDGRYMVTVACTPSDWRSNENTFHDAMGVMFK